MREGGQRSTIGRTEGVPPGVVAHGRRHEDPHDEDEPHDVEHPTHPWGVCLSLAYDHGRSLVQGWGAVGDAGEDGADDAMALLGAQTLQASSASTLRRVEPARVRG